MARPAGAARKGSQIHMPLDRAAAGRMVMTPAVQPGTVVQRRKEAIPCILAG